MTTSGRPTCDVPGFRVVELEPAMAAAVGVFDALEAVPDTMRESKRIRSLLATALFDLRQSGIPVPILEVRS